MEQLTLTPKSQRNLTKKGLIIVSSFGKQYLTENLFKEAIRRVSGRDLSEILYIGPTPQKLEAARKAFCSITPYDACTLPQFFTIKQFAHRLYERFGEREYLSDHIRPIILSDINNNISLGYARHVASFIKDVKHYLPNYSPDELRERLKKELDGYEDVYTRCKEAVDMMEMYTTTLCQRNLADDEEILSATPSLIDNYIPSPRILILDGFYDLTKLEEDILEALIHRSEEILATAFYDRKYPEQYQIPREFLLFLEKTGCFQEEEFDTPPKSSNPFLYAFPSAEEEVEGIAREIKRRFLEGNPALDRTIVTFSRITDYLPSVRRIFSKYGIPHSIAIETPLKASPPVQAILELLKAVNDDFPRHSMTIVLSSPYFTKIPDKTKTWISYYSKRAGIIKGRVRWHILDKIIKESGVEKKELALVKKVQEGINTFFTKLEDLKKERSLTQHARGLRMVLSKLGFCQNVESHEPFLEAKRKFFNILSSLEYVEERIGEMPCNLSHFLNIIDYLTSVVTYSTQEGGIGVKVMGFLDTRGIDAQSIFFGGLIEGRFPGHLEHDPILPERVKIELGLPNVDRYLKRQKLHYFRLCNSSDSDPYLSYPVSEGDRLFLPTPFFEGQITAPGQWRYIFSHEEEMRLQGEKEGIPLLMGKIDFSQDLEVKSQLEKKFGPREYLSVSGLERYRHCPYIFYVENVLNLKVLEEPIYEVEIKDWGTIAHSILALLYREGDISVDRIDEMIQTCVEKVLHRERLPRFWQEVTRRIFRNITPRFIALERDLREEGFYPRKVEYPLRQQVSVGLRLKGRVDRIDQKNGDTCIIDYKTGKTTVTQAMMDKGIHTQLPLYAKLLMLEGPHLKIKKVGIYSLNDMKITWFPKGNNGMEQLISVALKAAQSAAQSIRNGVFNPKPSLESNCRRCDFRFSCSLALDMKVG